MPDTYTDNVNLYNKLSDQNLDTIFLPPLTYFVIWIYNIIFIIL